MAKPYSMDLRKRVVDAVEREGMSRRAAAKRFGVAPSRAVTWVRQFRERGHIEPGQMGGHKPRKICGDHRVWLIARCKAAEFTLRGLAAELLAERDLKVDYRSVWEFVHGEGLSYKKNRSAQRTKSSRRKMGARSVEALSRPV
jgi:putative transposase